MQDAAMFEHDRQEDQEERSVLNHEAIKRCHWWVTETRRTFRFWSPMPDCDLMAALGIKAWSGFDWNAPDAFQKADKKLDSWLNWHEEDPEDPSGGISQDDLDFYIG